MIIYPLMRDWRKCRRVLQSSPNLTAALANFQADVDRDTLR